MALAIIGERLDKISAIRPELTKGMEISSNIQFNNISVSELRVAGETKKTTGIDFTFTAEYGKTGNITIEGSIFIGGDSKDISKLKREWDKVKKNDAAKATVELLQSYPETVGIINRALEISHIQALQLSSELRVPAPFQLPRFKVREKK